MKLKAISHAAFPRPWMARIRLPRLYIERPFESHLVYKVGSHIKYRCEVNQYQRIGKFD